MDKKLQKSGVIIIALAILITSIPTPTSAFFGFFLKSKKSTPQYNLFLSDGYTLDELFKSDNNKESIFTVISDNYLLGMGLPNGKSKPNKVRQTRWVVATAYSSTVDQTDSTPFITASGTHVRDGVIAANFLPIGTVVKIPDMYGNKTFIVEDRMNRRYGDGRIDIWFPKREQAKQFGIRNIKIEILSQT